MIEAAVRRACGRYGMLPPGGKVLCAVSGGADSVCLLHLLHSMTDVVCAHYNHRLRGAESDRDEAFVRQLCAQLGVPCVVGSGDVAGYASARGMGVEAAARALRYEFLERSADKYGCVRIATAHNANDNAETVLMHLIRGSGGKGLGGIPPVRGRIIRPLLDVERAEIEAYLARQGLSCVSDSSNGGDEYERNRIRHRVLPLLAEENRAAVEHICAAATLLREDEEYFSAAAEHFMEEHYADGVLDAAALLALARPIGARVLLRLCPGAEREHVAAVYDLCRSGSVHGRLSLPGRTVVRERDTLRFEARESEPPERRELRPGTAVCTGPWRAECRTGIYGKEIHNSFNTFCFKSEMICDRVYLTARSAGDSIRLNGRGCTKTLKKLLAEAEVPLAQRAEIPVLRDAAGVIGVYGFGIDERCAPSEGDAVLCVVITRKENDAVQGERI